MKPYPGTPPRPQPTHKRRHYPGAVAQPAAATTDSPLAGLEWLTPEDAAILADAIYRIVRNEVSRQIEALPGANRTYTSAATDPAAVAPNPPPPYMIERDCRPVMLTIACLTAGTTNASFDVLRSINGGATYVSMIHTPLVMLAGARSAYRSTFQWEIPLTRTLVLPGTTDSYPMTLRVGDLIRTTVTGGTGMKSLSMGFSVQSLDAYVGVSPR